MSANTYSYQNEIFVEGVINFNSVDDIFKNSVSLLRKHDCLNFNLAKVSSANSASIALIIEWIKYSKKNNLRILFLNIPDSINSLAKVCGVDDMFTY
ncbi:hypothetical protein N9L02_02480 [Gammaproteobacteria bacterium]|nr:hypothetical protein [Gammaproteobacteria bacterium]